MTEEVTYLMPIWVTLKHEQHETIIKVLNDELTEFFERQGEDIVKAGCSVDIQWSINRRVKPGELGERKE